MSGFNVSYEGKTGSYTVMADYPDLKHIISFEYDAGRFINELDIQEARKVAVIGSAVRTELFPDGVDPIGKYLKISGVYFEIVGITRTLRGGQMGDRDSHSVFVPFTTLRSSFHMGNKVGFFALTAKPGTCPAPSSRIRCAPHSTPTTASIRATTSRSARSTCSCCSASSTRSSSCSW